MPSGLTPACKRSVQEPRKLNSAHCTKVTALLQRAKDKRWAAGSKWSTNRASSSSTGACAATRRSTRTFPSLATASEIVTTRGVLARAATPATQVLRGVVQGGLRRRGAARQRVGGRVPRVARRRRQVAGKRRHAVSVHDGTLDVDNKSVVPAGLRGRRPDPPTPPTPPAHLSLPLYLTFMTKRIDSPGLRAGSC